jgi:hypothetical protein
VTGRIMRVYGTGASGVGVEYSPALGSPSAGQLSLDIGPEGDLWIAEYADPGRIRRIRNGGKGKASTAQLSITSANGDTYWPGQALKPTEVLITDANGGPLSEVLVEQSTSSNWPLTTQAPTNLSGRALIPGFAEVPRSPVDKLLTVSLKGLDGSTVATDTLSYQVGLPPSGSVTSWINNSPTNYEQEVSGIPLADGTPALTARSHLKSGRIATDSAGNTYWVDASYNVGSNYGVRVYKVSPDGLLTWIAGNTSSGNTGDGGDAKAAGLIWPQVAVHEPSGRLFIASATSFNGPVVVRAVDLATGIIQPFGGYGQGALLGSAFMDAAPFTMWTLSVVGDFLVFTTDSAIYRVDLTQASPAAEIFMSGQPSNPASPVPLFYGCYNGGRPLCGLAPAPDGKYYLTGQFSGAGPSGVYTGIALCSAGGVPEKIIAGGTTGLALNSPTSIVSDAAGRIFGVDMVLYTVYRVDPPPQGSSAYKLTTIAGYSGTSGFVDFVAGPSARFASPSNLAALPDGSLLIEDNSNHVTRRVWGAFAPN